MHQPLLQVRALTGEMRPPESLQSQNQLPQSSVVVHATLVAPLGLLGPDGAGPDDSVGLDSSVGDDEPLEPPPPDEEEEEVGPVVSAPPEHATRRPARKRIERGFMAAPVCNPKATRDSPRFSHPWRYV
jgi:hypothetical protein